MSDGNILPASSDSVERDKRGRFLKGSSGNPGGRHKGYDLRRAAEKVAAENGIDLPQALGQMLMLLIKRAQGGDVQAAKLICERLAMPDDKALIEFNIDARNGKGSKATAIPAGPQPPIEQVLYTMLANVRMSFDLGHKDLYFAVATLAGLGPVGETRTYSEAELVAEVERIKRGETVVDAEWRPAVEDDPFA